MDKLIQVKIPALAAHHYDIHLGFNLLELATLLPQGVEHLVIITDHTVAKLYGRPLQETLKSQGFKVLLLSFTPGESSKCAQTKQKLEEQMLQTPCPRNSLILALGGGVVGDLAGFIAATYMRGIPYIQIPTTLLAMIDSSVGGKTGINTPQGKNLIGAFWQPQAVVMDLNTLHSLPKRDLIAGLIEAIKIFLTQDRDAFLRTQAELHNILNGEPQALMACLKSALQLKASIVSQDDKELNLRKILNFGHTIGHALEQLSGYDLLHGEAVGYGILIEAQISHLLGILPEPDLQSIVGLLKILGIEQTGLKKFSIHEVIQQTYTDKKTQAGTPRYILLQNIGRVYAKEGEYAQEVPEFILHKLDPFFGACPPQK